MAGPRRHSSQPPGGGLSAETKHSEEPPAPVPPVKDDPPALVPPVEVVPPVFPEPPVSFQLVPESAPPSEVVIVQPNIMLATALSPAILRQGIIVKSPREGTASHELQIRPDPPQSYAEPPRRNISCTWIPRDRQPLTYIERLAQSLRDGNAQRLNTPNPPNTSD